MNGDVPWFDFGAGQLAALVAGATLIFWAVGAYNRLVELRNAVAAAWGQVQEGLERRGRAAAPLAAALAGPLASEQRALDTWLADHAAAERAAATLAARPLDAARAAAWQAAEATLAASASRVFALMDSAGPPAAAPGAGAAGGLPSGVAPDIAPGMSPSALGAETRSTAPAAPAAETAADLAAAWRGGEEQAQFARRLFNDAAVAHDAAIAQFPTSLLARLYAFAPAGRL
ncbi:MAG: LemA family protein [Pseudomonadota bacterium]|jgi:LemA protein|nr:LemA family protein [Rubrivivax sp.]MCA3256486.1 LemA family protein [Rubrivivax sp.]MCZ8029264.1 LemA family protein [Rubrivivax sp.]